MKGTMTSFFLNACHPFNTLYFVITLLSGGLGGQRPREEARRDELIKR